MSTRTADPSDRMPVRELCIASFIHGKEGHDRYPTLGNGSAE